MTKHIRIGLIVVTAVMGAAFTTNAMAASKQVCKDYARLAAPASAGTIGMRAITVGAATSRKTRP
jgi:hypothetical protein